MFPVNRLTKKISVNRFSINRTETDKMAAKLTFWHSGAQSARQWRREGLWRPGQTFVLPTSSLIASNFLIRQLYKDCY